LETEITRFRSTGTFAVITARTSIKVATAKIQPIVRIIVWVSKTHNITILYWINPVIGISRENLESQVGIHEGVASFEVALT